LTHSSENDEAKADWFHLNGNVFEIKYVLPLNVSANANLTLDVAVPENNIFQRVLNISSEPNPVSNYTDANGVTRLRFCFTTSTPRFLNVTINYTIRVLWSSLRVGHSYPLFQNVTHLEAKERYTRPEPYIESDDPIVIENAATLTQYETEMAGKIEKLFTFVSNRDLFVYDESVQNIARDDYNHTRGALWSLQNHRGVCFDFAHLFVALLRSLGICSRVSEGIILDGRSGFIVHDWAEIYSEEIGWIPYDPTWGDEKCNLHMKILNPVYETCTRWNYSIYSGTVHKFPENASYPVNDDIHIENVMSPNITDVLSFKSSSCINLTRIIELNNETIVSNTDAQEGTLRIDNRYGDIQTKLENHVWGVSSLECRSFFLVQHPENQQIQIIAPWNLIFSTTVLPSLGSYCYTFQGEPLNLTLVSPLLWCGLIVLIVASLLGFFGFRFFRKRRSMSAVHWTDQFYSRYLGVHNP
jgi:transglutaminase-like putative cysteine protease